jgi:hypothetical protein
MFRIAAFDDLFKNIYNARLVQKEIEKQGVTNFLP